MNTLQQDSDKKLLLVAKSENLLLSKYPKHSHENNKGTPTGFGELGDMIVYFKGTEDILFQLIRGNKGYLYFRRELCPKNFGNNGIMRSKEQAPPPCEVLNVNLPSAVIQF